jgi:phosphate-selective porin OprO/OprP
MKSRLFATVALAPVLASVVFGPAFAQDDSAEVAALKKEVQALEARLAKLEKHEKEEKAQAAKVAKTTTVAQAQAAPPQAVRVAPYGQNQLPASATPAAKASTALSNQTLSERVATLEEKQVSAPTVSVGQDGLLVSSADGQYWANVRGYVQLDGRTYLDGGTKNGLTDTFLVRSARPIIEAKMTDYMDARFMPDFGKGSTTLLDAYGNFHPAPNSKWDWINFRVGEMKSPVGLERWESESDVLFVERGQTTNLVPFRDIGIMAYGYPLSKQVEYEFGVMNGAADFQANTGDTDQNKDIVGRIFTHPLVWTGVDALKGLGVGVAGTYGNHQGTPTAGNSLTGLITNGYVTFGQRPFFTYSAATDFANGTQWRINPQFMYYNGPFGSYGEYVINSQQVGHGATIPAATTRELRNTAWEGVASYVLTGENAAFDGVKPAHDFNPKAGDWGAFELVGRLSGLEVDKNAFPTFSSLATSSSSAFERTVGATWYWSHAVKFNLDFSYTTFDHGALNNADHEPERAVIARTQLRF